MYKIPLYAFDEHNDAFYFWHKAKFEGYLNGPLDLLHIDAHDDIDPVTSFKKSLYFTNDKQDGYLAYYQDFAKNELKINNFIRPAILTDLIKNVYFIYPKWRKFKEKKRKFNLASVFGEGKVLKHNLRINEKTLPKVYKVFPDLKWFEFSMQKIHKIPENLNVILDIDFDYFACIDSILNHIMYELEITKEQFGQKDIFLANRTLPFSAVGFIFKKKENRYYCQVTHRKGEDISYLPPKEEVVAEIDNLVETLKIRKIKPAVITISRSCYSGYCPKDYGIFIEDELRKKIGAII
ncbi:MAG: UPF0489 family protein [Candidatus Omnitrophota bacterium]